jgi:hypothetical protein
MNALGRSSQPRWLTALLGNNFATYAFPDPGKAKEEAEMKLVVLGAAVGTMLLGAVPASAQVVVHDRDDVVVHRHYDRGHHYGWYKHHAECPRWD